MAPNKYLIFLFFEHNDSISAKSTAQILPSNLAHAFLLLNFLITGLCIYVILQQFVHLHSLPILFSYQKTYRSYLLMLFDISHSYHL